MGFNFIIDGRATASRYRAFVFEQCAALLMLAMLIALTCGPVNEGSVSETPMPQTASPQDEFPGPSFVTSELKNDEPESSNEAHSYENEHTADDAPLFVYGSRKSVWNPQDVVAFKDFHIPEERLLERVSLIEPKDFRYPIRMVEVFNVDALTGDRIFLKRTEMVANRVLIQVDDEVAKNWLQLFARSQPHATLSPVDAFGLFRLDLDSYDLDSVPLLLKTIEEEGVGAVLVEPDHIYHPAIEPNDSRFGSQWALNNTGASGGSVGADIGALEGWDVQRTAPGVVVAIIDSGIRYTHEDLRNNMWVNPDEIPNDGLDNDFNGVVDDVHGYNVYSQNGNPTDSDGHGTHVAGIVGAQGNNGTGVSGVAWDVQLMALKFLHGGSGSNSDAVTAIHYAIDEGADIINASWGGVFSTSLSRAIQRANSEGVLFVVAAGNDGEDIDAYSTYPPSYGFGNMVVVANSTRTDSLGTNSNYGVQTVDVAAPGTDIWSTWIGSDASYRSSTGTSMAAPCVSGIMALLMAEHPDESIFDLITRLKDSVVPLIAFEDRVASGGRVSLRNALVFDELVQFPTLEQPLEDWIVPEGDTLRLFADVKGTGPFLYNWYRNGVLLNDQQDTLLEIPSVSASDSGTYAFVASSPVGEVRTDSVITVTGASSFATATDSEHLVWATKGDKPWSVASGVGKEGEQFLVSGDIGNLESSSLRTLVVGPGTFSFWWKVSSESGFDDVSFRVNNEVLQIISGNKPDWERIEVTLESGVHELEWIYEKDGSRAVGNDAAYIDSVTYVADRSPVISEQPQGRVLLESGSVSLSVKAEGSELRYKWYHDGHVIENEESSQLVMDSVTAEDTGEYLVIVSNHISEAVSEPAKVLLLESFSEGTVLQDFWMSLVDFMHVEHYPWVYHEDHGWWFVAEDAGQDGYWFYDSSLGWMWTDAAIYPYFWVSDETQWYYFYQPNAGGPRWWFSLKDRVWLSINKE